MNFEPSSMENGDSKTISEGPGKVALSARRALR